MILCPNRLIEKLLPSTLEIQWGWNFAYKVSQTDNRYTLIISLIFVTLYIRLPIYGSNWLNEMRAWGVYWYSSSLWFQWDEHTKGFDAPWHWKHVRHQVMYPEGLRYPKKESWDKTDGRLIEQHPYTYVRKNGKVQHRVAVVSVDEREWRWRCFTWLPWPNKIERCIEVDFNDEVGEESGSWKGGTVGCGYVMLPNDSMESALRRMEKDRKF